jgi:hypothetical protein
VHEVTKTVEEARIDQALKVTKPVKGVKLRKTKSKAAARKASVKKPWNGFRPLTHFPLSPEDHPYRPKLANPPAVFEPGYEEAYRDTIRRLRRGDRSFITDPFIIDLVRDAYIAGRMVPVVAINYWNIDLDARMTRSAEIAAWMRTVLSMIVGFPLGTFGSLSCTKDMLEMVTGIRIIAKRGRILVAALRRHPPDLILEILEKTYGQAWFDTSNEPLWWLETVITDVTYPYDRPMPEESPMTWMV